MRVLDGGHRYELQLFDCSESEITAGLDYHELHFVKRTGLLYPGNKNAYPGTNSQEVLRALADRALYLNRQEWSWQTWLSIGLMQTVIWLYEWRAAKRHRRRRPSKAQAVYGEFCLKCGHVGCFGRCR